MRKPTNVKTLANMDQAYMNWLYSGDARTLLQHEDATAFYLWIVTKTDKVIAMFCNKKKAVR